MRLRRREVNILAIDDKFEHDIDSLIEVGKEKGYLTYGDVNDILPEEIGSADDLDDLITTIGTQGIDLLDSPKFPGDKEFELEEGEDVELDLTPGTLEKTNDPVRMYLREMGTVPLLTREGEVEIAKRIERGQLRVLKAISRSPIVIREIVALGEDLKRGVRNVKEVVIFDEEELTEEVVQARVKATVARIDALIKHQKKIPRSKRSWPARRRPRPRLMPRATPAGSSPAKKCSSRASSASSSTRPWSASACSTRSTRPSTPCAPSSARFAPSIRSSKPPRAKSSRRNTAASRKTAKPISKRSKATPASPSPSSSAPSAK